MELVRNRVQPLGLLSNSECVCRHQQEIYKKAKQDKTFRFYSLYDKIRPKCFFEEAYARIKAAPQIRSSDGIAFYTIEEKGISLL